MRANWMVRRVLIVSLVVLGVACAKKKRTSEDEVPVTGSPEALAQHDALITAHCDGSLAGKERVEAAAAQLAPQCPPGTAVVVEESACGYVIGCYRPDNTKHGRYLYLFTLGIPHVEGSYVDGKQDGVWRQRAIDGRELGTFTMDHGTGTAIYWADDGKKILEIPYLEGRRHGKEVFWLPDGRKIMEVTWVNGEATGD